MKEYTFRLYDNFLPNPDVIKKTNMVINFKYCNLSELCWIDEEFNDNIFTLPNWVLVFDVSYNSLYALYKGSSHDYELPKDLQVLNMSFNKLDFVPDIIPKNLVAFNVSNNTVKYIPKLPETVKVINASHNTIKWFDQELENLQKLNLSHNHIYYFRFDRIKENLTYLDLTGNQLKEITGNIIPENIRILKLAENRIEAIPELPEKLEELDIRDNKLKLMPNYPVGLERLDVSENYLELLDDKLMLCKNLVGLNYEKNESIEISFELLVWIDEVFHRVHMKEENIDLRELYMKNYEEMGTVYKDSQNAHNLKIRNDIIRSMENILRDGKPEIGFKECCEELGKLFKVEDTKKILMESNFGEINLNNEKYTLEQFFPYLYNRIVNSLNKESLVAILEDEIQNTRAVCFSGRIEAYITAFASFYEDISYSPSLSEQVLAKIDIIKKKLYRDRIPADSLNYQVEMRYYMEKALDDMDLEEKNDWLMPIDDLVEDMVKNLEDNYGEKIEDILERIKMRKLMREYFVKYYCGKRDENISVNEVDV